MKIEEVPLLDICQLQSAVGLRLRSSSNFVTAPGRAGQPGKCMGTGVHINDQ